MNTGKDKKLGYLDAIRFLSPYIIKHKSNFMMFYFGWFFDMLLSIVMPVLFGIMIDEIVYHQNLSSFLCISLVYVIMSVFSCILYFLIYAQHQYLMSMYVYDIQRDVFRHLQKCDAVTMSDAKTGDIIAIIQHYSRECMHFVIRNIIHITNGCIELILLTVYVFIINPWVGLLILAAVPASVITSAVFGRKIRSYSETQREVYSNYISYIYEVFTAIRDIRLLGAVKKVNHKVVSFQKKMFGVNMRSGVSTITAQSIIDGVNLVIRLAILTLAAFLVRSGDMTIGMLTIVMTYFSALTWRAGNVSGFYLDAQNRIGYIQRIHDFLENPTEESWPGKKTLDITKGEIQFANVSFAYPGGKEVLSDLSLHIAPGERFALCGRSGCGKTTLGYLLIGFYTPQSGDILVDGQRLSECTLVSIRRNIGIVSQDVLLFDGSIRDNMLLGRPNADDSEIISALRRAGIWDHICTLPDGLDTVVGSQGIGLSGGQKQRLSIARIYLKDPKIIIFDEATSSLDSQTEQQIHEAWEDVLRGRTSIIIAHRQSSVMLCDRAAVMENGIVADIGDPETMERSSGYFRNVFAVEGVDGLVE
jgi:ABC-type bacteriocin/lantibiotic exporter with double-glycine peptidase domain